MKEKEKRPYIGKFINAAGVMAGVSIALVGIIILIAYEFFHANVITEAKVWIRIAHISVFSTIAFAFSSFFGLTYEYLQSKTEKSIKILEWLTIIAFSLGWVLMFTVLGKIFIETW